MGPRIAVIGAGNRGETYSELIARRGGSIVAVAEPEDDRRNRLGDHHGVDPDKRVTSWDRLVLRPGEVDGVVIATMDDLHVDPTLRFVELGVPILLEKPLGPSWAECERLTEGVAGRAAPILVGHVLRYAPYTTMLDELIHDGVLGDVVTVHHHEPVGFWHFAHSYVRGRWRSEEAGPLIVTKACHDVDWVLHVLDQRIATVASFGSLTTFTPETKPSQAADRCVDCEVACAYDARSIYVEPTRRVGRALYPATTITDDWTLDGVTRAVETGAYGRCVYDCDNTVVDHQVAVLHGRRGGSATITVSAFSEFAGRTTRIGGTRAEALVTADSIEVYSYLERSRRTYEVGSTVRGGHGGGDDGLIASFLSEIESPTEEGMAVFDEAVESHRVAFAIDQARRGETVVHLSDGVEST